MLIYVQVKTSSGVEALAHKSNCVQMFQLIRKKLLLPQAIEFCLFWFIYTIRGSTGLDRQGLDMIRVSPAGTGAQPG